VRAVWELVVLLVLFFLVLAARRRYVEGRPLWRRRERPDGSGRRGS
jgi:hypothetical protein